MCKRGVPHPQPKVGLTTRIRGLTKLLVQVFDVKDWETLMSRSIVPKLAWALQSVLAANPMQPDLAALGWALTWQDVLPKHLMVALFEGSFFPPGTACSGTGCLAIPTLMRSPPGTSAGR